MRYSDLFKVLPTVTLAASIVLLPGCKSAPKAVAPAPISESPRVAHDEATKDIPPDLISQTPIYPGSRVDHVRKPRGAMREILFTVDAPLDKLVAFYKDGLKKGEFRITSSLIMPARKTWSCDFHKQGRPGSIMLYPSDADKTKMTVDLIYEMPAKFDPALFEPKEDFDVVGPGEITQQAQNPNASPERN